MTNAKKTFFAVAGGLIAVGIVIAAIGFIASGFNPAVFSTQIDMRDNTIVLGGTKVDDPAGIFPIEQIARLGEVAVPEAPAAPSNPT